MEFKQYPSYKPSGVEWLGDVPEHWQIVRTKDIFNHRKEEALEDDEIVTAFRDGQVTLRKNRRTDGFTNSIKEHGYQHINSGDLVIHEMDAFAGAIGVSDSSGKSTPVYSVCYAKNENINHHFYSHFFRTMAKTGFINSLAKGIRVRSTEFRWNESRNVYLVEPPKSDQQKIVAFLDTETTRIDNLIAKQEKLIELLEEQRKSIISHAVTKGLNPNAPMKDSGVEWLGEVPEHWDVAVVKRAFIVKLGKMLQPDQKDETDVIKKYLKASNLTWDGVKDIDNEMWFSKNDLKKLKLEIGDLLVAEGGDVGKSCIFDSNEEFYYQNSVNRVRGQKNNANKFLYYWLFTLKYSGYIDILCNKSTIAHFTAEKLNETILLLPDSVEQNEIIAYLERENGKINQLILKQQSLIEKLKEYRASIISHAVTGKIDVREFGA
ncbi:MULTISPECIES: restriction endonuclease subunit S [Acinetobacter]|uniref:restriction endonuclease subunit S n=1 Tax=Acinetobacter TaxID=469 RepID=UPI000CEB66B5|nr:restriction endonuclease subunit S [Acinetobacter indicus]AVH15325.1 restriction endonuclease subunit S [Acinetobacter indicus]